MGGECCLLPMACAVRPGLERSRSLQPALPSPLTVPVASGWFPGGSSLPASISPPCVNVVLPYRALQAMSGRADCISIKPCWIRAHSRCRRFPSIRLQPFMAWQHKACCWPARAAEALAWWLVAWGCSPWPPGTGCQLGQSPGTGSRKQKGAGKEEFDRQRCQDEPSANFVFITRR